MSRCGPKAYNIIKKETLVQVLSCNFCEISSNNRAPLVAAPAPRRWPTIYTDRSELDLGSVLYQMHDGQLRILGFGK